MTVEIKLQHVDDYDRREYGILYTSEQTYCVPRGNVKLTVWDNVNRPYDAGKDERAWRTQHNPRAFKYLDPMNHGTDNPRTVLIEPQSVMITDTGRNSGYATATDRLTSGDVVTLVYPNGDRQRVSLHFMNGSAHGDAIAIEES